MDLDYLTSIEESGARVVAAVQRDPAARIPWSDGWLVAECAQHVGIIHHWVSAVVDGRPTVGFEARAGLDPPEPTSPELAAWIAAGTAGAVPRLAALDPGEACWSWWPEDQTIGFWRRRVAQESLVHAWDLEAGAGIASDPMAPALAADGIDELLDIFVGISRVMHQAPGAGESIHVHCTDTDGEWLLAFPSEGAREVTREHAKGDVALRGPAEGLLLHLWGRGSAADFGVEVVGDASVHARWTELVPPM